MKNSGWWSTSRWCGRLREATLGNAGRTELSLVWLLQRLLPLWGIAHATGKKAIALIISCLSATAIYDKGSVKPANALCQAAAGETLSQPKGSLPRYLPWKIAIGLDYEAPPISRMRQVKTTTKPIPLSSRDSLLMLEALKKLALHRLTQPDYAFAVFYGVCSKPEQ